jgi:hypothetical protein
MQMTLASKKIILKRKLLKLSFYLRKHKPIVAIIVVVVILIPLSLLVIQEIKNTNLRNQFETQAGNIDLEDKTFVNNSIDHASLLFEVTNSINNENPNLNAATKALNVNSLKLANYIGSFYGEDKRLEFLQLWNDYNEAFISYLKAKKANDTTQLTQAISKISGYSLKIASFYNSLNNNFSLDMINLIFSDYTATIKTLIDSYSLNDYDSAFSQRSIAINQITKIGTLLADAISKSR